MTEARATPLRIVIVFDTGAMIAQYISSQRDESCTSGVQGVSVVHNLPCHYHRLRLERYPRTVLNF